MGLHQQNIYSDNVENGIAVAEVPVRDIVRLNYKNISDRIKKRLALADQSRFKTFARQNLIIIL